MDKATLRQHLRARRQSLTPQQQKTASHALLQHLLRVPIVRQAAVIALYSPTDGEIDVRGLMSLFPDKTWAFPRVVSVERRVVRFYPVSDPKELVSGTYGIAEPAIEGGELRPLDSRIDVVITPLVGFDASGNRLGMGGGYYDRFFQRQPQATRIGVAYAFQQVDELPTQPWDRAMHYCVTDAGLVVPGPHIVEKR